MIEEKKKLPQNHTHNNHSGNPSTECPSPPPPYEDLENKEHNPGPRKLNAHYGNEKPQQPPGYENVPLSSSPQLNSSSEDNQFIYTTNPKLSFVNGPDSPFLSAQSKRIKNNLRNRLLRDDVLHSKAEKRAE